MLILLLLKLFPACEDECKKLKKIKQDNCIKDCLKRRLVELKGEELTDKEIKIINKFDYQHEKNAYIQTLKDMYEDINIVIKNQNDLQHLTELQKICIVSNNVDEFIANAYDVKLEEDIKSFVQNNNIDR